MHNRPGKKHKDPVAKHQEFSYQVIRDPSTPATFILPSTAEEALSTILSYLYHLLPKYTDFFPNMLYRKRSHNSDQLKNMGKLKSLYAKSEGNSNTLQPVNTILLLWHHIGPSLFRLHREGLGHPDHTSNSRKKMPGISRNRNKSSNLLQFLLDEVKALVRKRRSAELTPYLPYDLLKDHIGFPTLQLKHLPLCPKTYHWKTQVSKFATGLFTCFPMYKGMQRTSGIAHSTQALWHSISHHNFWPVNSTGSNAGNPRHRCNSRPCPSCLGKEI